MGNVHCIREKEQGVLLSLGFPGGLRGFLLPRKQVTLNSLALGGTGLAPRYPGPTMSVLLLPGGHLLALAGPDGDKVGTQVGASQTLCAERDLGAN